MTSHRYALRVAAQLSVRMRDIVALVLFVALTACQDADVQTANVAVRDSAGIEIIENADDPWSAEELWHVAAEPVGSASIATTSRPRADTSSSIRKAVSSPVSRSRPTSAS